MSDDNEKLRDGQASVCALLLDDLDLMRRIYLKNRSAGLTAHGRKCDDDEDWEGLLVDASGMIRYCSPPIFKSESEAIAVVTNLPQMCAESLSV
jgi:hypothetical protein